MEISLFLIGWLFGAACGVAFMATRGTSKDLEKEKYVVRQLECRDEIIKKQREIIKALKGGKK